MSGVDVLAVMDNVACGSPAGHDFRMARAAVAELIEANRKLTKAVRAFADGEMSTELRNRLFLKRHEEPAAETLGAVCLANDEAEAALARVQGGQP
jgi:superfamily II DNA helicase RecQ